MKSVRGSRQRTETIRPEIEILLCCASARTNPGASDRLRGLLQTGLDWNKVVANADRHRMSAVLFESIEAAAQDLVSPEELQMLRDDARAASANTLPLVGELLRLHQHFEAAGISIIPYKGPVLATLAYGNFARRNYADLDFALPQQYIPQANLLLQGLGYRPLFDLREAHAGENDFAPGQYTFLSVKLNILVELHTERTLRYYPAPFDFQDLTSRLIGVEIAGQSLRTFSVEDTMVILCVHGAKHFWERLFWILDVARLIEVQDMDWSLLEQIAARMESTRVLLLGLYLAHDLFGVSLPDPVLRDALGDQHVQSLARQVCRQFAENAGPNPCPNPGIWSRTLFRIRSRDKFWQGLRHTLRLGMSPTESDRQTLRLPRYLAPLYVIVRPWRLLREYGLGARRPPNNAP
jgi:Uncharacterised nucleotidyltransferase